MCNPALHIMCDAEIHFTYSIRSQDPELCLGSYIYNIYVTSDALPNLRHKNVSSTSGISVKSVTYFSRRTLMGRQDARTLLYNIKSSVAMSASKMHIANRSVSIVLHYNDQTTNNHTMRIRMRCYTHVDTPYNMCNDVACSPSGKFHTQCVASSHTPASGLMMFAPP